MHIYASNFLAKVWGRKTGIRTQLWHQSSQDWTHVWHQTHHALVSCHDERVSVPESRQKMSLWILKSQGFCVLFLQWHI